MPFNRPPRILTPFPKYIVEIPTPPQLPQEPGALNWLGIILPLGATLLMIGLMFLIANGGGGGLMYLMFLPMMLAGFAVTYFSFRSQKTSFNKKVKAGKANYAEQLEKTENHLYTLREIEHASLCRANPDLRECLRLMRAQDSRLGERRPADADFLTVRVGAGILPSKIEVRQPDLREHPLELEQWICRAKALPEKFAYLPGVPITVDIWRDGSIGIAGKRKDTAALIRSILCQLATHHWLSEVHLAVLSEAAQLAEWKWVAQLPHSSHAIAWQKAVVRFSNAATWSVFLELENELHRRDQILESRKMVSREASEKSPILPIVVLVLDSIPMDFSHPGVVLLLKRGKSLGVFVLYLTDAVDQIPGECGAILAVEQESSSYQVAADGSVTAFRPDVCDVRMAEEMGQALARVDWAEKEDLSQPPAMVTFLNLFGVQTVDQLPVEEWWNAGSPYGFLRTPIGKTSATSECVFDLRDQDGSHGPHGLLGGMTGSGKSEVLKSLILALAVTSHPYDVNFALVDYKGGAAFNELAKLPHTVGVMTDIESHASYAERVLSALAGEMERRKRILERARSTFHFGRSHVDDYRQMRVKQPLPHLVIVFDEFAEFKSKHPEESKRLISIARLGRSLGIHLILATQNIQAAIDPQIMQNSNFRICLRTSQPEDSIQMIGIPDAIQLVRGRAYFYANGRQLVQIAYCGGAYANAQPDTRLHFLTLVHPDGRSEKVHLEGGGENADIEEKHACAFTEASAVVDRLQRAMTSLNLRKPDPVWMDPLPDAIPLPLLMRENLIGGWDGKTWQPCRQWGNAAEGGALVDPIIGVCDCPQEQRQPLMQLSLREGGGHILVFGSASSGKTTFLQTLVCSITRAYSPAEAHVYILDFGAQTGLEGLSGFPHVGAVVNRFEPERADRLIRFFKNELRRRNGLFYQEGVGSMEAFNQRNLVEEQLPHLFLCIDNFLGLKRTFDIEYANEIAALAGGGASSGIHLAITSFLPGDLPVDLVTNIHMQATFHQSTPSDYFSVVGVVPEARLQEDAGRSPRAGRGFLRHAPPIEWHAALPAEGASDQERRQNVTQAGGAMRRAWTGAIPMPIESLPFFLNIQDCPAQGNGWAGLGAPLGKDFESLRPIGFDLAKDGPAFLITSSAGQSGKTTALLTWVLSLAEKYPPQQIQFILFDFYSRSLSPLSRLAHVRICLRNAAEVGPCFQQICSEMKARASEADALYASHPESFDRDQYWNGLPRLVVLLDDYERFANHFESERRWLADGYAAGAEVGLNFFVAGNAADLPRDYDDPFLQMVRRQGSGLLFSGNAAFDQFNNAKSPPSQPLAGLPPGRGYFIRKGHTKIFQQAAYFEESQKPLEALLEQITRINRLHATANGGI
jgi:DNA segregation ATPase FtsK/SpoIIIE, S-DNA-T family